VSRKLGAIHRPPPHNRLRAGAAILAGYTPAPACNYTEGLPWDGANPLGNDNIGDCVEAAFLQLARARWKRVAGEDYGPTTGQAIALYTAWGGYNPANPATDQGTDVLTALDKWGAAGIWIKPDLLLDIGTWFAADIQDLTQVRAAIDFGTGALCTLQLFAGDETASRWDTPPAGAAVIGGHEVVALGYTPTGCSLITWDLIMPCTWPGLQARLQAVEVPVSRDLVFDTRGLSGAGQKWDRVNQIMADALPDQHSASV